jgi:glycyl-tRNA synthetase beta subunit
VAGAFVGGKVPSGSEDPYGVRRAGQRRDPDPDRAEPATSTCATQSMEMTRTLFAADPDLPQAEIMKKLGEFWRGRVEVALDDRDIAYDTRDAALEAAVRPDDAPRARPGWIDPADALARAGCCPRSAAISASSRW